MSLAISRCSLLFSQFFLHTQLSPNYPNIKMTLCQRVRPAIYLHISLSNLHRVCPWELEIFPLSRWELLQSFSRFYFAPPSVIGQCVHQGPEQKVFWSVHSSKVNFVFEVIFWSNTHAEVKGTTIGWGGMVPELKHLALNASHLSLWQMHAKYMHKEYILLKLPGGQTLVCLWGGGRVSTFCW